MKGKRFSLIPLIITAAMILLASGAGYVYFGDFEYRSGTRKFNRVLGEKERIMSETIEGMKLVLSGEGNPGSATEANLISRARDHGITILEYLDNKLVYWSDNEFDVPLVPDDPRNFTTFVFIQNGWFLTKVMRSENETIVGLLRLRNDYGFENEIIKNGFLREFGLARNVGFSRNTDASDFRVHSLDGTFLFCLMFPEVKRITYFIVIPLLLWIIAFFMILKLSADYSGYLARAGKFLPAVAVIFLTAALIYLVVVLFRKPAIFFRTELFSPFRYTMNFLIPSLGNLLILGILFVFLAHVLNRYLPLREKTPGNSWSDFFSALFTMVPGALLITLSHFVMSHLVYNSTVNFETFKVLDLDILSLAGFITIILFFIPPLLYILRVFRVLKLFDSKVKAGAVIASSLVIIPFLIREPGPLAALLLLYLLITLANSAGTSQGIFNKVVLFTLIFAFYSGFIITGLSERKTEENIKIQLVSYSTENDPYAEHLLLDMWPVISRDSILKELTDVEYFESTDVDRITDYLHSEYFTGYWGNFTFSIVLCKGEDSLLLADRNNVLEDCFSFFDSKIKSNGVQLTGTGFFFMDNNLGRSNYLGRIFFDNGNGRITGLFIDLYNDINVFQPGYSELLLDKKYHSYAKLKEYSFAKYINGQIVMSTGDFPYSKTDVGYIDKASDYRTFRAESFRHVLYRNGNVTVVISQPALTVQDIVISVAYLFAFIFLFANLMILLMRKPELRTPANFNFRHKMQLSFIGILLFSFTLVGFIIVSSSIKQFESKHYENLKEKLNSVYTELESRISAETYLTSGASRSIYGSLNEVLVRLSNIFNTDINLYDVNGFLIATSRPEIFYRNLTSRRMDIMAQNNLSSLTRSEFFQKESIGNLDYISGYKPFFDDNGKVLTYLNLPYFRMQSVLAGEISNMVVAVINFTLLLIVISMSLAVFISSRLTAPLSLLSERLASVELGKKSEHLTYLGNDEVGDLVRQYNIMVDELEKSAGKLARSERESAWRDMAKQIAHEIKNPLTPMKLNIQQLYKSWKDGVPGFEKKIEKFTRNQIEYIDSLSAIATAFSSFAKLPDPVPVTVDLVEQIKTTLELFKNSDNITFRVGWPHNEKILIFADREQVSGIFSNLIKNSIQSIPSGREGFIRVSVQKSDAGVVVSIEDNGSGIPDSLKSKMFTPNFTTKSSGTGLGLSIVKRYAENAGGRVWFDSEQDKGSVFHVEFPVKG